MAGSYCAPPSYSSSNTGLYNVTELLQQRWEDSPKDDRERLERCWGYNDCGDCHRSDGFCGWCAISQTCLPLPSDSLTRAFPLLSPTRYKFICAMDSERFELRTSGLGCQVSTITFLTSIVTIFATIGGLIFLYLSFKFAKWVGLSLRSARGGWTVYEEEIVRRGEVWKRKPEGWGPWWRRMRGNQKENEVLIVDDGSQERSRWVWRNTFGSRRQNEVDGGERRALLS